MKVAGLLKTNYINYSPVWRAHVQGKALPAWVFKINKVLLGNAIIWQSVGRHIGLNQKICGQFDTEHISRSILKGDEQLGKSIRISRILMQRQKYLDNLRTIYVEGMGVRAEGEQRKDVSMDVIKGMIRKCESEHLSITDLLVLLTLPLKLHHFEALVNANFFYQQTQTSTTIFTTLLIANISVLQYNVKCLRQFKTKFINAHHLNRQDGGNTESIDQIFMKVIQLITYPINDKFKINKNMQNLLLSKVHSATGLSYLELLANLYVLYLEWMAMKILLRPNRDLMQKNFSIFIGQMGSQVVETHRKKGVGNLDPGKQFDRQVLVLFLRLAKSKIFDFLAKQSVFIQTVDKSKQIRQVAIENSSQKVCQHFRELEKKGGRGYFAIGSAIVKAQSNLEEGLCQYEVEWAWKVIKHVMEMEIIGLEQCEMRMVYELMGLVMKADKSIAENARIHKFNLKIKAHLNIKDSSKQEESYQGNGEYKIQSVKDFKQIWKQISERSAQSKDQTGSDQKREYKLKGRSVWISDQDLEDFFI